MRHRAGPALILPAILLGAALGCASGRSLYGWGHYSHALYAHYKNPQDRERFVEALEEIIVTAEGRGLRVPPGIYAEYGYALYEVGRFDEAADYFGKERGAWPESRVLMEKMIRNAKRQGGIRGSPASPATGASEAGAAGGTRP